LIEEKPMKYLMLFVAIFFNVICLQIYPNKLDELENKAVIILC